MHIKPNANIEEFLKQIRKCRCDVMFETPEGDRLALKSTLSQYIFCTIASNPQLLKSGALRFEQKEDQELMKDFLDG